MSGTAGVPNSFANAVTATGAQLDANYTTLVAYINNPTNRNNYAADGAATNTVVLSFSPAVVGGYTTGLEITWKWGQTNTGAVVVNANGLGNVSIVNPDGSALAAGQGTQGSIGKAVYDGTRFIYLTSFGTPASQAQMESATSAITFVSPANVKYHPLSPKAWCVFDGTAVGTTSVTVGFGVNSVVRNSAGNYSLGFSTPYSSANYGGFATPGLGTAAPGAQISGRSTATCTVVTFNAPAGVPMDVTFVHFISFGDLP